MDKMKLAKIAGGVLIGVGTIVKYIVGLKENDELIKKLATKMLDEKTSNH